MPSWDDQFDFDDLQDTKTNKPKPKISDKKYNHHDQFFDDEDDNKSKQKKHILPTINSRNSASSKPIKQSPSSKKNPYADKSFGSKQIMDDNDFQEQIADQIPQKKVPPSKQQGNLKTDKTPQNLTKNKNEISKQKNEISKNKSQISNQYEEEYLEDHQDEPFHQSLTNNKSSKSINIKQNKSKTESATAPLGKSLQNSYNSNKLKQEPDEYEDQFQNQEYHDDDFEEDHPSPVKNIQIKTQQKSKPQSKPTLKLPESNLPPKNQIPVKTNNLTSNQTKITPNQTKKQPVPRSQSVIPPKPPTQDKKTYKQEMKSNKNINKIESRSVTKPLKRSSSRQSIRSNGEKSIKASRISQKNESQFFPNRHSDIVAKSFPHEEDKLNSLSQVQINKINQKMRAMIRKFNQELNDLINKNMLLLKNKGTERNHNVNDKIRELELQKKTGQTAIEVIEKDLDKLHGRAGQLKQEEYQLILERQIEQKKTQIKQTLKQITNMKRDVDSKGKKLSVKQVDQKNAQNIHHLKTILIQSKKDEEKGDEKIQKLISTQEDLQTKLSDMDYKLDELISQARQKGVSIQNNDQLIKRFEELKTKLQNSKNFNKKTEGLISTKIDILNHQNEQVRIMIRNINSQIHNLYGSIDHSQGQAIKLIEKAKEKQGVNPLFAESLDKLLKQIQQSRANNDYFDNRSQVKSRRSDTTKTRPTKNSQDQHIEKSMPLRATQSQNRLIQNQQSSNKPKFNKKKLSDDPKFEIQNKNQVSQRVWNQEDQNKPKITKNDQNRRSVQQIPKKQPIKEKVQISQEQKKDKSKPFMLKKNKNSQNKDQKSFETHPQVPVSEKPIQQISLNLPVQKDESKKEQTTNINLVPRMMKFGRKKNNEEPPSQNNIPVKDTSEPQKVIDKKQDFKANPSPKNQGLKLNISEPVEKKEQEGEKPIFVPKRFNLRNKAQKKDDSYTPSIQNQNSYVSSVVANVQKSQSLKNQTKQEYKPKFDFKNEEFKAKQEPVIKKQAEKPIIQEPQIKPRFNLRLRDRSNKNDDEGYTPNIGLNKNINGEVNIPMENKKIEIKAEAKINLNSNQFITPKQPLSKPIEKLSTNPYAPKIQTSIIPQNKNVEITKNLSPQKVQNPPLNPVNNPYAAKFQTGDSQNTVNQPPKRERGPLKKNKITSNIPKQSFNIYAQADDITNEVKQIGGIQTANKNVFESAVNKPTGNKKQELNLNEMLGIKKEVKKNDFDDLLGDMGGVGTKNKKKNNDFFSDLQF